MCFLSSIDDTELRKLLFEEAKKKNSNIDQTTLLSKATKLNRIMKENQCGFEEAQAWLLPEKIHIWLLQGIQLAIEGKLSFDTCRHISSFFTDPDIYFNTIPKGLYEWSVRMNSQRFFKKSFTSSSSTNTKIDEQELTFEEYIKKQNQATSKYQERKNCFRI